MHNPGTGHESRNSVAGLRREGRRTEIGRGRGKEEIGSETKRKLAR